MADPHDRILPVPNRLTRAALRKAAARLANDDPELGRILDRYGLDRQDTRRRCRSFSSNRSHLHRATQRSTDSPMGLAW